MIDQSELVPNCLVALVQALRARLVDAEFKARHRSRPQDFTRHRCLSFSLVMLFTLQKTLKSVQRHLNEVLRQLAVAPDAWQSATPQVLAKARAKLRPSAFVELNTDCVLPMAYGPEQRPKLRFWHEHRLIGFDSSLVWLPYSEALAQQFRVVAPENKQGPTGARYCEGRISVVYDLLNRIGLEGQLVSGSVGEVGLAIQQLAHVQPNDVVLNDCGFTGYVYLVHIRHQRQAHFISRCSAGSFYPAQELFRQNRAGQSVVTRIFAPREQRAQLKAQGLPLEMVVRFISLRLPDGTLEVLVTSLLEEAAYPTEEFGGVYHWRWGQETFHYMLKSRLDLENWSAESPQAVQQDFAASLLLCNLESLLTQPAQQQLDERSAHRQAPLQVNRAVAYHTLKLELLDLLAGDEPAERVVLRLQKLFVGEPVKVRPNRQVPRKKWSAARSYRFQRCKRKIVF
ncbi:MAG TPA: IS4 family transposase [Clostridia bacterium]|nr:IS4 family transposase [Clostridia bacterium]